MEIKEAKLEIKWNVLTAGSSPYYSVDICCTQNGPLPTNYIFTQQDGPDVRIELYTRSCCWFNTSRNIFELKAVVNRIKQEFSALVKERTKTLQEMSKSLPENEEFTVEKDS